MLYCGYLVGDAVVYSKALIMQYSAKRKMATAQRNCDNISDFAANTVHTRFCHLEVAYGMPKRLNAACKYVVAFLLRVLIPLI